MKRGEYNSNRQKIISRKRSLTMSALQLGDKEALAEAKAIITPPKLPDVYGYQIFNAGGDFEGFTLDEEEAYDAAAQLQGTVKKHKAIATSHLEFDEGTS